MRKAIAGLLAFVMTLSLLTGAVVFFSPDAVAYTALDYNEHDTAKLRAFFEIRNSMNITNGHNIMGSAYDPDLPDTWSCCTWTESGLLETIAFNNVGVVGALDLEGCVGLTLIETYWCQLSGLNTLGCPLLVEITADGNLIPSIDTSQNPLLRSLWIGNNQLTEIDVSSNPALQLFSCNGNQLTTLDVSYCPQLTYLHCGNNELTELNVDNCPLLTSLSCQNNFITQLDISQCANLAELRTLRNPLTTLDLSVMNGGESFLINAVGNGYIGVRCDIGSYGVRLSAVPSAQENEEFLGWYVGDTFLTVVPTLVLEFGNGAIEYNAHFSGDPAPLMLGDVDGDNDVDSIDALLTIRYRLGIIGADDLILAAADVNFDGVVDMLDALAILRHTIGLLPGF